MSGVPNNAFFRSEPGGREAAPAGPLALVQAFVNTGATEGEMRWEEFTGPDSLSSWFKRKGLLADDGTLDAGDVVRAKEVREALRSLLAANNGRTLDPESVRVLNRAAERSSVGMRFGADGRAMLEAGAVGVDGAIGRVLAAAHAGMQEGTWARLKACANGGCGWAFYDRSKNRSGRWCSMVVCGNRRKTRAYRRRASDRGS